MHKYLTNYYFETLIKTVQLKKWKGPDKFSAEPYYITTELTLMILNCLVKRGKNINKVILKLQNTSCIRSDTCKVQWKKEKTKKS